MKKIICFHNPDEINGYLSNWYLSDFNVGNVQYSSMEQYMMYQKALLFDDMEIAGQILNTTNVGKIKALGRSVKNYPPVPGEERERADDSSIMDYIANAVKFFVTSQQIFLWEEGYEK